MPLEKLSESAVRVLEARYLKRGPDGHATETPEDLFARVARGVAEAELRLQNATEAARWERAFADVLYALDFVPAGATLMNAGTVLGQLSACAVLPIDDSLDGVFTSVHDGALLQRTGASVGFSFSHLRPRGEYVASTGGEAAGPARLLRVFDAATEHTRLGGRGRGASLGALRVDHPDVLTFLRAKQDAGLTHFNLAIAVTDDFMDAVRGGGSLSLVHPRTRLHAGDLPAREVWNAVIEAAHATGDPGLSFLEAIERNNPTPDLGPLEALNPCGEVPLLPGEACPLGALNLAHMVRERSGKTELDWEKLGVTTRLAVRFLDDAIEVGHFPVRAVDEAARRTRKMGIGVMGFHELLIRLGIPYGSDASIALAERIAHAIDEASLHASQALAEERGVFPAWQGSTYKDRGVRVRNAARVAIAPTGALSLAANTTPSIEPLLALAYQRGDGQPLEPSPLLRARLSRRGLDVDRILDDVKQRGSLRGVPGVPDDVRRLFVTALEVPPERHLAIQAAFQRHVDGSVSKTIHLPADATRDDVAEVYLRAWDSGLKGVSVYRYGTRDTPVQPLLTGEEAALRDHASRCELWSCRP